LASLKKENLGRETVLGYPCTKMRIAMGNLPSGQPLVATAWVADSLELPLRLETMGITQENRNLQVGPQPASLFEIPAGFTKTNAPGMPAGMTAPAAAAATTPKIGKAACDRDAPCRAWTLVKLDRPGGMGYCYLKNVVPPAVAEDCCISGLKGATGAAGGQSVPQTSKYPLEMNVNRIGEDYHDFLPTRASTDLCAETCAKESRCKAWTWVKNDLEPPAGHCWLKSAVPEPGQDGCCVSGVKR
jgi:hypothetical protein